MTEGANSSPPVAFFTDSVATDPVGNYSATIDWGDGTAISAGLVVADGTTPGQFVLGNHTYVEDGSYTVTVGVIDSDSSTGLATATATVADAALASAPAANLTPTEGTSTGGTSLAVLTDADPNSVPADFVVAIDWGDGSAVDTSSGVIIPAGPGAFIVGSSGHTYADECTCTVGVTIADTDGGVVIHSFTSTSLTATVGEGDTLSSVGAPVSATEGVALAGVLVAGFSTTYAGNVSGDFTASIDWGDGTTTAGTVNALGGGNYLIGGDHTYTDEGSFTVTTTVADDAPGTANTIATSTATVAESDSLVADAPAALPSQAEGATPNQTTASFTNGNPGNTAADFTATIDWGDGTTTAGTVSGGGGSYSVSGSHAYADEGSQSVITTITDDAPGTNTATATNPLTVTEGDTLVGTGVNFSQVEGSCCPSTTTANFTDTNTTNTTADFQATIDWGDGSTTTGVVTGGAGAFSVHGTHSYPDEGTFTATTTLSELTADGGTATASATSTATVTEGDSFDSGGATPLTGVEGATLPLSVDFTDGNTGNTASDFTASIDWGDGSTTAGTVTGSGTNVNVAGSHAYLDPAVYDVSVTLSDPGGTSMTVTTTATITEATITGTVNDQTGNAGTELTDVLVATFVDNCCKEPTGEYVATVDWGDGTTTTGVVVDPPGTIHVHGTHTYAAAGTYTLAVSITDPPGNTFRATGTATIGAALPNSSAPAKGIPWLPIGGLALGFILVLGAALARRRLNS